LEGFDWLKDRWMMEEKINKVKELATVANEIGLSLPSLSIAWCINNPNVTTAILGATKKEQLLDNLKAMEVLPKLTEEVMNRIDAVMKTKPVLPEY
jgi:aryl-alcohol dehydrogenase-like predicted oxidoreductase